MARRTNTRRYLLTLVAAVGFVGSGLGVAALAQSDGGDVFTGCLNENSGVLRNVAVGFEPAKACNPQELQITWDRAGPAFDARIAALEERIAELEAPFGTLDLFVDCAAGETIGAALAEAETHVGSLNITVSGVCEESVVVVRDDVSLSGVDRSDGIRALSTDGRAVLVSDARRVVLSNMTIIGGERGIVVHRADASAVGITVRDNSGDGIVAFNNASFSVRDSVIVDNGSGVGAGAASIVSLTNSEVSGSSGTGVSAHGGTMVINRSEIVGNEKGAVAQEDGTLRIVNTEVEDNQGGGVLVISSRVSLDGAATRIAGNGGGIEVTNGSSISIETGPVLVEDNRGGGIVVFGGSALRAGELIVRNNDGNGISVGDLSTLNPDAIQVVDNNGWGIFCEGPPAVAVFGGQVFYDEEPVLSGNVEGDTNCFAS